MERLASVAARPNRLDTQIIETLTECSSVFARFGIQVPATSPVSLERLAELGDAEKTKVLDGWRLWLGWAQPIVNEQGSMEVNREQERRFAEKALEHFGLHPKNEFWDMLKDGQIIEIYGHDMIQLYRSLSFFKFCGYSLLDISVHEWYVLWDRPKRALELLVDHAKKALAGGVAVEPFSTPRHIVREGFMTGLPDIKPRAYLAEFKHIGSLVDHLGRPAGFICTSDGEFLAEGDEAFTIQFV